MVYRLGVPHKDPTCPDQAVLSSHVRGIKYHGRICRGNRTAYLRRFSTDRATGAEWNFGNWPFVKARRLVYDEQEMPGLGFRNQHLTSYPHQIKLPYRDTVSTVSNGDSKCFMLADTHLNSKTKKSVNVGSGRSKNIASINRIPYCGPLVCLMLRL